MTGDGFINLLKPPGMTSHDAVAYVRAHCGVSRVGHLGTLDPAAAGVLPIAVGRATRLFDCVGKRDKAYRADIVFGLTTDTLDAEGQVTSSTDASNLTESEVHNLLAGLLGEGEQVPPRYSAAHVGGSRMHELARRGVSVSMPPRRVHFLRLDLVAYRPGPQAYALVDVLCSAGTYIRVLAEALGRAAGCGAYLRFLLRTRAGRFALDRAATLEELADAFRGGRMAEHLLPPDWPLNDLPRVDLTARAAAAFVVGTRVLAPMPPAWPVTVYCGHGLFLGLGEVTATGQLRPRVVLATREEVQQ